MGSGQPDSDAKMELDDSGCVQDESPPSKPEAEELENGYVGRANLLDLSDDVLLYILRYCAPHDLKALGFSCPRLGSLVLERSLWTSVDARDVQYGRLRTLWLMDYALHRGTRTLKLTGLAKFAEGCQGHTNQTRKQAAKDKKRRGGGGGDGNQSEDHWLTVSNTEERSQERAQERERRSLFMHEGYEGRLHMNPLHHLPRLSISPNWPNSDSEDSETDCEPSERCKGPVFTLGRRMLKRLRAQCPLLTTLYLEYCNINCNKIPLSTFPPTLKCLSLRGSRCFNLPLEKSYFFKIQDYMPQLEHLELSNCSWLEPASLLPLSKLPGLRVLRARRCPAMQEFVAYISLATRYGFSRLEVLDLRGSPVGDSEVAALGWLPELRELYLSAPPAQTSPPPPAHAHAHTHYNGRRTRKPTHADAWEIQMPDYYATLKQQEDLATDQSVLKSSASAASNATQQSAIDVNIQTIPPEESERDAAREAEKDDNGERKCKAETEESGNEAGPSKRPKEESVDQAIASIQNSSTSVTRGNGFVTFRRTVFNNVTDINQQLNSSDHHNSVNENHKKDDEEKQAQNTNSNNSTFSTRVNIDINAGASTSNSSQFRVNVREPADKDEESSHKCDGRLGDVAEDTMDPEGVPPAKKSRLLSDVQYQKKLEKMSTSSSDGNSESMDVNIEGNDVNSSREGLESSEMDSAGPNFSSLTPSSCNSPDISTGLSESPLSQASSSLSINLNRLRRVVGLLEANPTTAAANRRQAEASLRPSQLGSSSSVPNNVGCSSSNRIPAPSMEGPSRQPSDRNPPDAEENPPQYVRFRRNEDPIIIQCPARQDEQAEPRHHVLYVNLGQQLHAVYRLLPSRPVFQPRSGSLSAERLDASSLVTDTAIRRFGRADGENVNVVNIGPNGPQFIGRDTIGRPNRSNLRVLSATGYRNITNRSLVHLATAAPYLEYIDFTETRVTEDGVEQFRSIRPDCQVEFSAFKELSDEL